jgi:hypothetical protein
MHVYYEGGPVVEPNDCISFVVILCRISKFLEGNYRTGTHCNSATSQKYETSIMRLVLPGRNPVNKIVKRRKVAAGIMPA